MACLSFPPAWHLSNKNFGWGQTLKAEKSLDETKGENFWTPSSGQGGQKTKPISRIVKTRPSVSAFQVVPQTLPRPSFGHTYQCRPKETKSAARKQLSCFFPIARVGRLADFSRRLVDSAKSASCGDNPACLFRLCAVCLPKHPRLLRLFAKESFDEGHEKKCE